jgi:hypothetical protein
VIHHRERQKPVAGQGLEGLPHAFVHAHEGGRLVHEVRDPFVAAAQQQAARRHLSEQSVMLVHHVHVEQEVIEPSFPQGCPRILGGGAGVHRGSRRVHGVGHGIRQV